MKGASAGGFQSHNIRRKSDFLRKRDSEFRCVDLQISYIKLVTASDSALFSYHARSQGRPSTATRVMSVVQHATANTIKVLKILGHENSDFTSSN